MLHFNPDVRIDYFSDLLATVLQVTTLWSLLSKIDVTVTLIDDTQKVRVATTLHYFHLVVHLSPDRDRRTDRELLANFLRRWLHPLHVIDLGGRHVHVEWDAHRGASTDRV